MSERNGIELPGGKYRLVVASGNWVLQRWVPESISTHGFNAGKPQGNKWDVVGYYGAPEHALQRAVECMLRDGVESGEVATLADLRLAIASLRAAIAEALTIPGQ